MSTEGDISRPNKKPKKKQGYYHRLSEEEDDPTPLEDIVDDDSLKDINLLESDEEFQETTNDIIKVGDFLLAHFKGGKRHSVMYRYVVSVSNIFEDGELYVNAMISDGNKNTFKDRDDLSTIAKSDIIGKLPMPDISMVGGRPRFIFEKKIDVFEMKHY